MKKISVYTAVFIFSCTLYAQQPQLSQDGNTLYLGDCAIVRSNNPNQQTFPYDYGDNGPPLLTVWGEEIRLTYCIEDDTTYKASAPKVGGSGDTIVLAYSYYTIFGGGGKDIIKSIDFGDTWSQPYDFILPGCANSFISDIVMNNETIYVCGSTQQDENGEFDHYYSKSTDFGETWQAPLLLYPGFSGFRKSPQLVLLESNLHCIFYLDHPLDSLFYRKALNYGQEWTEPRGLVYCQTAADYRFLMQNSDERLHIVFEDYGDTIDYSIEVFHLYSADGGDSWDSEMLSDNDYYHSQWPNLSVGQNGEIIITWFDYKYGSGGGGFTGDVLARISYDDGETWGDELRLTGNSPATSTCPFINAENIGVVWVDHRTSFFNSELYYTESVDGGITWSDELRLTNAPHMSAHPLVYTRDNDAALFWEDSRDGENFQYEIYMRYFDATTSIEEGLIPANRFSQVNMVTYPNPFNESVTIEVTTTNLNSVDVGIYNVLGELIRVFINLDMTSNQNQIFWDGTDKNNRKVASGIYFIRSKWKKGYNVEKVLLMK